MVIAVEQRLIGGTLATDVLHRLREDIVSCVLKPGERLRFEALREIYGVSFSTLREALSCLAAERLVIAQGQRGFVVAPISREDLLDLTDARILIEKECLRRAINNGNGEWEVQIISAYHRLDRVESRLSDTRGITAEWDARHFEFHESLVSAANSRTLAELQRMLFERARRYRRLSSMSRVAPRAKTDEHRTLMEAVLSRDIPYAQDLMERHIRETTQNLLSALESGSAASTPA